MGFKRVGAMDAYEVIRRWHDNQKVTHIGKVTDFSRKTVRKYIAIGKQIGLSREKPLPLKEELLEKIGECLNEQNKKPAPAQALLKKYLDEIRGLINNSAYPLKPKIAFEVICEKHDLKNDVSYSSFKRFIIANDVTINPQKTTCRIEVEPGKEVQIDYGYMGLMHDPELGRKRKVYAFIATLSHSRHQYVEFTYKQDQQSFVGSHIRMFSYFEGVPERLVIDNLKAGVIKPDLYDPALNRAYREMAEHYNCFIDPCRVGHPKDKGKVENQVPVVRQQFFKQLALNSTIDIIEANDRVKEWCLGKYGHRKHGTTQWQPYPVFVESEKPELKSLPEEHFEPALWKEAKVHIDQYIQFDKKMYSVPQRYVGKKVWVKGTESLIQIFYNNQLIQQHVKTKKCYRHTDFTNFPENVQAALNKGMPKYLQWKASKTGYHFGQLVRTVLEPHAFINMRKAQGLVALVEKYDSDLLEKAAELATRKRLSVTPKSFKMLIEKIQNLLQENNQIKKSERTSRFVRDMDYFIQNP